MKAQIETMMDDPIELSIAEARLQLAKTAQKWNAIKDFYRPIINSLQRLGLEPRLSSEIDLNFSGDAHMLAAVVRILRTAGFTTTSGRPKQGDTTWGAFYSHPDCSIRVWLFFTSSVCKRVKVGTKMVEQDVYEVQCGDIGADIESEALPPVAAAVEEISF